VTAQSKYSFEEFRLYYQSAERVSDRRLETNRWNYSICIANLVAIAISVNWGIQSTELTWIGLSAAMLLSVLATFFCALWVVQIQDFKNLNTAKFSVLNDMAPNVHFETSSELNISSFTPFQREWRSLEKLDAIQKVGRSNIVALKSSSIEYFIPKAFFVLFCLVIVAIATVSIANWPLSSLAQSNIKAQAQAQAHAR